MRDNGDLRTYCFGNEKNLFEVDFGKAFGRNFRRPLHFRGSLLLEIAIALSVIGLISGFFVSKSITMGRVARERKTKNNIEIVTAALASYLAIHKRLPRPAF